MLRTSHLTKIYERNQQSPVLALDDITIDLPSTGLIFLTGKSGSGKSTLLNIIGALDKATSGSVVVHGQALDTLAANSLTQYRKTTLGFVFQDYNLLPEFTVTENIRLALDLPHQPFDEVRMHDVLRQLDLEDIADTRPNELSGGQMQRIAIARAILKNTTILLADEPTGNLDDETAAKVFQTFRQIAEDQLVIVVTHDVEAALQYGDRVLELSNGRIASDTILNPPPTSSSASSPHISKSPAARSLSLRAAWRLASSSLRHRIGRRIITMFVIILTLGLFGLSDLIGRFSVDEASYNTFRDTSYRILPYARRNTSETPGSPATLPPTPSDRELLAEHGFVTPLTGYHLNTEFYELVVDDIPYYNQYYIQFISGIIEVPDADALPMSYVGAFPTRTDQIMINNYMLEHFIDFGFQYYDESTDAIIEQNGITGFADIEGKTVRLRIGMSFREFEIVGMVEYDLADYHARKSAWDAITEHSSYSDKASIEFAADQQTYLGRLVVVEGFYDDNVLDARKATSFSVANLGNHQDVVVTLSDFMLPHDMSEEDRDAYMHHDTIDFSVLDTIDPTNYHFGDAGVPGSLEDDEIIVPSSWFDATIAANLDTFLGTTVTLSLITMHDGEDYYETTEYDRELTIVGFYMGDYYYMNYNVIVSDTVFEDIVDQTLNDADYLYTELHQDDCDKALFQFLEEQQFQHTTTLSQGIYHVADLLVLMRGIFFYVSWIMLLLALVLIFSVMSGSVVNKRKQIGILRVLGASRGDVFRIFALEGGVIMLVCLLLAMGLMQLGIAGFNDFIRNTTDSNVILLAQSIRSIGSIILIALFSIAIGTYLPVHRISNSEPYAVIRDQQRADRGHVKEDQ